MTPNSLLLRLLCLSISIVLFTTGVAHSRDFKLRKKSGNFTVEMKIDRNPPIVAKNRVTLEIKDNVGRSITDAKISVNYYMPPMPGMPPMNYTVPAQVSGNAYTAIMDLIMAGPWNIVVKVTRAGKTSSVSFAIDVR